MATMKAARWHAAKDVRIEEVEVPEVQPHQVKVAVKFTGICGTDLHEYLDGPIFIPTEEHVYSGQKAPVTLGHEFSGEIVEVGSNVTRVKVGDRVTIEPILAEHNLIGDYNLDPNLNFVGLAADGGFAKYCVLDGDLVHVIPDSLSYEQAALKMCIRDRSIMELVNLLQSIFSMVVLSDGPIKIKMEVSPLKN